MNIKEFLIYLSYIFILVLIVLYSYRYEDSLSTVPLFRFITQQRLEARENAKVNKLNIYMVRDTQALFDCLKDSCPSNLDNYISYFIVVRNSLPRDPSSYALLGFCYGHLNRTAAAIKHYKRAIELNPRFFWSYYDLGLLVWADGNPQEAAFLFKQSLLLNPQETIESILPSKLYMSILAGSKKSYNIVDSLQNGYQQASDFLSMIERGDQPPSKLPLRFF